MNLTRQTYIWLAIGAVAFWWLCMRTPKAPVKSDITLDDDVILGAQGAMYPLDEPNLNGDNGEYAFV